MGETTEDQLGDLDPDYDPNTMKSRSEAALPAASDIMFLNLFERFVKAQEDLAKQAKRQADTGERLYELAVENSKSANRLVKGVARAVERDEAECKTCHQVGKCLNWCFTKKYP